MAKIQGLVSKTGGRSFIVCQRRGTTVNDDLVVRQHGGVWDPRVPVEPSSYLWSGPIKTLPPKRRKLSVVDVFSGCGGLSYGFSSAGFDVLLGIDNHAPSLATFQSNHPDATALLGDVRGLKKQRLERELDARRVDVLIGGAPCQGFSICNRKQYDDDPRNRLFIEFAKIIEWVEPTYVLFENVSTIRSAAAGEFGREIVERFSRLGYAVTAGCVNAYDYGVPQRRIRWVVLASREGAVDFPETSPTRWSVAEALGDLPSVAAGEASHSYAAPPANAYQKMMRVASGRLTSHEAPRHPVETIERIRNTRPGAPMYESFKQRIRLHPDKPSPTIVSGGIRPQFSFGHYRDPRGLTVRELCRVQSFPDRFDVAGGAVQGRVQIGNAVPPLLARAFALQIAAHANALEQGALPLCG